MNSFLLRLLLAIALFSLFAATLVTAQVEPAVGIRQNTPSIHAFTNARIITSSGKTIEQGTLVIRDGVIEAVGSNVTIPADARVWDLAGMTVYPGLIDGYSDIGMPKRPQPSSGQDQPAGPPKPPEARGAKHWNENIQASLQAEDLYSPDQKLAEKMRGMGFTTALVVPQKGTLRGSSAVFNLGDGSANVMLVKPKIAQHASFETSFGEGYPNSLMGAIALIRQTVLDAQWHRDATAAWENFPMEPKPEFVPALAALAELVNGRQPIVFETSDEMGILRAARIAKEFSLKYMVRGSGYEYRRLDAVKQTGATVILPVNFPETPSVQTPEDALSVGLE